MSDGQPENKIGLAAALAETHDPSRLPGGCQTVEQAALFPLSQTDSQKMAADAGLPAAGKGRPAGAKNKSTQEWRDYLLARFESPLVGIATIATASLPQLRAELNEVCGFHVDRNLSIGDAIQLMKIRQEARKELAPYLHSKQPIAIEGGQNGLVQLIINHGSADQRPASEALDIEFIKTESESNQSLSDRDFQESNGDESNESEEGVSNE